MCFDVFLRFALFAHHLNFAERVLDQIILVAHLLPYFLLIPVLLALLLSINAAFSVWSVDSFWNWRH